MNLAKTKITQLYSLFGISLILSCVPNGWAALGCLVGFTVSLVYGYGLQKSDNTFQTSHAIYLVRTIWIGSFIGVFTIVAGAVHLLLMIDHQPLMPCMDRFMGILSRLTPDQLTEDVLMSYFKPCIANYWQVNRYALIIGAIITLGPVIVYFIYRYGRGLRFLLQKNSVTDAKRWL